MGKDVIIALDFDSREKTLAFLDRFTEEKPFVKVGMELFYAEGSRHRPGDPAAGATDIFLDLKLHDIPNTVRKAMAALSALDVDIMQPPRRRHRRHDDAPLWRASPAPDGTRPLLIAVTQLTSTDQERMERELLIHAPLEEVVLSYAANAAAAGLDGVVCSPLEAGAIHRRCGASLPDGDPRCTVCRMATWAIRERITTPAKARELGSDYIVVGRPITQAENPVAAYRRCVKEFAG